MHVLVVTVVHHPEDARIYHRQIRALLDAGHKVTYVAPFAACGVSPPVTVQAVSVPRAVGRRRLRAFLAARRAISEHGPGADLVLFHDLELLPALRGLHDLPPVVWDVHEDTAAAVTLKPWLPPGLRWPVRAVVSAFERIAERRHHLLLAEESYQGRFRSPHPVVPNATWVPPQVPPPGDDRIVYVGHLTCARGALEMIEVSRRLHPQIAVELIGPADDRTRPILQRARDEGVLVWRGFQPNDQAMRRVRGALAGLALLHDEPNYRHSQPTKVLEYMANGVPVITTPLANARSLVDQHGAGLVVPFADAGAVVAAVHKLRDDPMLRADMARRGHEAARDRYSWEVHAKAFVAQLENWAGARGSDRPPSAEGPSPEGS